MELLVQLRAGSLSRRASGSVGGGGVSLLHARVPSRAWPAPLRAVVDTIVTRQPGETLTENREIQFTNCGGIRSAIRDHHGMATA